MNATTCTSPQSLVFMRAAYDRYSTARMLDRADIALKICERVLDCHPDSVEWRLRAARNCLDLGRQGEAVAALDIARRYARCDLERAILDRLHARIAIDV